MNSNHPLIILILRIFSIIYLALLITACGTEKPADPMCRIDSAHYQNVSADAGCIIRVDKYLVTIGNDNSAGLAIPGGKGETQEAAQCTAHRNTWEQTGFNVEVGKLLGKTQGDYHYFECTLAGNFNGELLEFSVPEWANGDVDSIKLVDPFVLEHQQWQNEDELVSIRDMYNQTR